MQHGNADSRRGAPITDTTLVCTHGQVLVRTWSAAGRGQHVTRRHDHATTDHVRKAFSHLWIHTKRTCRIENRHGANNGTLCTTTLMLCTAARAPFNGNARTRGDTEPTMLLRFPRNGRPSMSKKHAGGLAQRHWIYTRAAQTNCTKTQQRNHSTAPGSSKGNKI